MDASDGLRVFLAYHRRMFAIMAGVCLAVTVGLAVFLPGDLAWAGGFAAGAAAQLVKFGFMDVAVVRKVAAGDPGAPTAQVKSLFLSLVLFGLAVVVVFKFALNVWAMAAGIFLPRLILLADAYIRPDPFRAGASGRAETKEE